MRFYETALDKVFIIEPERLADERGFFACSWFAAEFEQHGLNSRLVQCNISFNQRRGTVRGMHLQIKPHEQTKLMRCTRGGIYDVAVDMRPHSPTLYKSVAAELTADNHRMLYIPEGF